jgi:hypothetical protein
VVSGLLTKLCASQRCSVLEVSSSYIIIICTMPKLPSSGGEWAGHELSMLEKAWFPGPSQLVLDCFTRPYDTDFSSGCLGRLQVCSKLIRKKLRSGTPHEYSDAVIAGRRDGGSCQTKNTGMTSETSDAKVWRSCPTTAFGN